MNVGGPPSSISPRIGLPIMPRPEGTPRPQPPQPGSLNFMAPQGFQPAVGSRIQAQVASQDSQGYLLRLGPNLVRAQSGSPLPVGQSIQLTVQAEKAGQLQLKLTPPAAPARHTTGDIAHSLAELKLPVTESNLEMAQAMAENRLPLSRDNLESMQRLTQLPDQGRNLPPMAERVKGVALLQQNQLPTTPHNVASLANFLAHHPQLGQQMAAMNQEFKRLLERGGQDEPLAEELREHILEAVEGKKPLAKSTPQKTPPRRFFQAARQAGIEFGTGPFPGNSEDEWEVLAAYRELRRKTQGRLPREAEVKIFGLLEQAEETLQAQVLLNQIHIGELGCLYFQIPLRPGLEGEVWLYHRRRDSGSDANLGEEFRAEFLVSCEHLESLFFILEVAGVDVSVTVEVENPLAHDFVANYAAVLQERVEQAGWRCGPVRVVARETTPGNPWLQRQEILSDMVSFDVQA